MSTTPVLFNGLFSPPIRDPSVRTYFHKVGNKLHDKFLPQLKPAPVQRSRSTKRKLADESPEPEPDGEAFLSDHQPSEATEKAQRTGTNNTYPFEDEYDDNAHDDGEGVQQSGTYSSSLPIRFRRTTSALDFPDEDDGDEGEDGEGDEDEGDQHPQSTGTPITEFSDHSTPQTSSVPAIPSSVRRKPFLIINKTPSKSTRYKKLKKKGPDSARSTVAKSIPGDGFSGSEARPNGLFHHKRRRLHFCSPAVGILDLTQTPPWPLKPSIPAAPSQPKEPRIILKRKKRARDNSFLPPTPKKPRQKRPQEEGKTTGKGQPEQVQLTLASGISAPYGQIMSSVILGEPRDNEEPMPSLPRVTEKGLADELLKDDAPGDNTTETPSPVLNHELPVAGSQVNGEHIDDGLDQDIVFVPYAEDDYVPATQYPRAKSLPPVDTSQQKGEDPTPLPRLFRRVKTK